MVLQDGGPCSVCNATSSHKWYGGIRKPSRCKKCYEEAAKEAVRQAPVVGRRHERQSDSWENNCEGPYAEDKMLWEIHEVLGIRLCAACV